MSSHLTLTKDNISFACLAFALYIPFVLRVFPFQVLLSSDISLICTMFLLLACFLLNFSNVMKANQTILLIVNVVVLFLGAIKNQSLGVVITYLNVVICLLLLNNVSFTYRQIKFIRLSVLLLIIVLLASFTYKWQYGSLWVYDNELHINSNTYGLLLLAIYLHTISLYDVVTNKKRWRVISIIITPIVLLLVWFSGCRSALLAIAFFALLLARDKMNYRQALQMLVIIGLAFPVIYIYLSNAMENIQILGKSLFSGRQTVWMQAFVYICKSPFLGTGTNTYFRLENGLITDSAHNVYLAFCKTMGIIPMFSFIYFLFYGVKKSNVPQKIAIGRKAFLAVLLVCVVESILNDTNYNVIFALLLMKCRCEEEEKR